MGPVISKEHKDKIISYIDEGVKEGADLILDGRDINIQGYEKGRLLIIEVDELNFVDNKKDLSKIIEKVDSQINGIFN